MMWNTAPRALLPFSPRAVLGLAMETLLNHPISCIWLNLSGLAHFTVTERADAVEWRGLFSPKSKVTHTP